MIFYLMNVDTENKPIGNVEINTDLPIKTENGEIDNSKITFSPEAAEISKNLTNGPDIDLFSTFYELMNGKVTTTNNNKFILTGNIQDFQNKVGDASSFSRTIGNYSKGNRLKLTRRDKLKE